MSEEAGFVPETQDVGLPEQTNKAGAADRGEGHDRLLDNLDTPQGEWNLSVIKEQTGDKKYALSNAQSKNDVEDDGSLTMHPNSMESTLDALYSGSLQGLDQSNNTDSSQEDSNRIKTELSQATRGNYLESVDQSNGNESSLINLDKTVNDWNLTTLGKLLTDSDGDSPDDSKDSQDGKKPKLSAAGYNIGKPDLGQPSSRKSDGKRPLTRENSHLEVNRRRRIKEEAEAEVARKARKQRRLKDPGADGAIARQEERLRSPFT